jgi:hypothetical protein
MENKLEGIKLINSIKVNRLKAKTLSQKSNFTKILKPIVEEYNKKFNQFQIYI